jgi:hypothetical protein
MSILEANVMGGWGGGYYEPPRPKPGSKERPQGEIFPDTGPTKFPPIKDQMAWINYGNLRHEVHELECLIESVENDDRWTEKDLKRLDKAVTVMKAGFKIIKKALKSRERRRLKVDKELIDA